MDRSAKIVVALLVIAASAFFLYTKLAGWHKQEVETAVQQELSMWQGKTGQLEQKVVSLQKELEAVRGLKIPEDKLALVFGEDQKSALPPEEKERLAEVVAEVKKVADIESQIMSFFSYLDKQSYVQSYNFEGGTYLQYQIAINKLSSNPPVIVGEMQSLYTVVRNVAHFYRVMGKKLIFLTRQILQNESDVMESVLKTFYQWYTMAESGPAAMGGRPSPEIMYEYAGYLLNTLGGRSYLLRRSPKLRTLTTYYCVLALDKANEEELNSTGIDIRPYIKSCLLEINNQIGLVYQKEYIAKLSELSLKYQAI